MQTFRHRLNDCPRFLAVALAGCLLASCGGGSDEPASQAADDEQPVQAATRPAVERVEACSVLTKADVEAATGRTTLEPVEEDLAELSTCSFGDPDSPLIGGRAIAKVASLSVMSGSEAYFEGPVEQVKAVFEMAAQNAGGIEEVSGLGDMAHWAGRTLRVLRGPYLVEVEVDSGKDDRAISEQLARTVLGRLPQA